MLKLLRELISKCEHFAFPFGEAIYKIDLVIQFNKPIGFRFYELVEYLEKLFNRKVDVLTPDGIESIRNKTISSNIKRTALYV